MELTKAPQVFGFGQKVQVEVTGITSFVQRKGPSGPSRLDRDWTAVRGGSFHPGSRRSSRIGLEGGSGGLQGLRQLVILLRQLGSTTVRWMRRSGSEKEPDKGQRGANTGGDHWK